MTQNEKTSKEMNPKEKNEGTKVPIPVLKSEAVSWSHATQFGTKSTPYLDQNNSKRLKNQINSNGICKYVSAIKIQNISEAKCVRTGSKLSL